MARIIGTANFDRLIGTAGDDYINGLTGTNYLTGGEGSDYFDGRQGYDIIVEKADANFIISDTQLTIGTVKNTLLSIESAYLTGGESSNVMSAKHFSGKVTLYGLGGNDYLYGGAFNDHIYGGEGDDVYLMGRGGNDYIDGGAGIDQVYERFDTDFTLTDSRLIGRGTDTLRSIERGYLVGGETSNRFDARHFSGSVNLFGEGGDDRLYGGNSADTIDGGTGNEALLWGQGGDDLIDGGEGTDRLYEIGDVDFTLTNTSLEGRGTDTLVSIERAYLVGGVRENTFDTRAFRGSVQLEGKAGDDSFFVSNSNNTLGLNLIDGGDGYDTVIYQLNDEKQRYFLSDEKIETQNSLRQQQYGLSSIEHVKVVGTRTLDQSIVFNVEDFSGKLEYEGGVARDIVTATHQDDILSGGSLADIIHGRRGNDLIYGDDSSLRYRGGSDEIHGGHGDDTIYGGDERSSSGGDLIYGGYGNDLIYGGDESITTGDTIDGGSGNDSIHGGSGNDHIDGGAGDDELFGEDGIDSFSGGLGNDLYDGGGGFDRFIEREVQELELTQTQLISTIGYETIVSAGTDTISSIEFFDFSGNINNNLLDASNANSRVKINGYYGNDTIRGGSNSDILAGYYGSDILVGNAGNDTLNGSTSSSSGFSEIDFLTGGSGRDEFVLGNGSNTFYDDFDNEDFAVIKDLNQSEDVISLHGLAEEYVLGDITVNGVTGVGIYSIESLAEPLELIGIVQGDNSGLNLNSQVFDFI